MEETNENEQEFLGYLWEIFRLQENYDESNTKFSNTIIEKLNLILKVDDLKDLSEELKLQIPTIFLEIKSFFEENDIGGAKKVSSLLDSIKNKIITSNDG